MPIYEFRCKCGKVSDELLSVKERDKEIKCSCGQVKERQISSVSLVGFDNLGRSRSDGK